MLLVLSLVAFLVVGLGALVLLMRLADRSEPSGGSPSTMPPRRPPSRIDASHAPRAPTATRDSADELYPDEDLFIMFDLDDRFR